MINNKEKIASQYEPIMLKNEMLPNILAKINDSDRNTSTMMYSKRNLAATTGFIQLQPLHPM
ncbi:hypothetical protein D3C75_1303440 [compost metagenome]